MSLFILFICALGAATILPFSSELVFIALLHQGENMYLAWAVATLGNTLGALVNWLLGRYCYSLHTRAWFPFKQYQLEKAGFWFQKYGKWSLLLAWLPAVGDAFTFIAGVMRLNIVTFIVLTAIGKGARYAFIVSIFLGISSITPSY